MVSCFKNKEHFFVRVHNMTNFIVLFMFNSQTAVCMKIFSIFAQKNLIQSVQPTAKLMAIHVFSVMKWCKKTTLNTGFFNIIRKPSQNDRKIHVSDSLGTLYTVNNYYFCKCHINTLLPFPEVLISKSFVFDLSV